MMLLHRILLMLGMSHPSIVPPAQLAWGPRSLDRLGLRLVCPQGIDACREVCKLPDWDTLEVEEVLLDEL